MSSVQRSHWTALDALLLAYEQIESILHGAGTADCSTVPLYGCEAGGYDHFVSFSSICEGSGYFVLGINGWIYSSPPQGISTRGLYRCPLLS
ncbi:MAG TPA: hypothetical protein VII29_02105, partial [Terriglobales bacterium]